MGWKFSGLSMVRDICRAALVLGALAATTFAANAQTNVFTSISNSYLTLSVGVSTDVAGSFSLVTSASNPGDPNAIILFGAGTEAPNNATIALGTHLFVRVDGGKNGGGSGYDYIFGRATEGIWVQAPRVVGQHIEARWRTLPVTFNSKTIDPQIEVDLIASFVHDQVRFQFNIVNQSPGQAHTVGLAFTEDVDTTFITTGQPNFTFGGPLRLPNAPYLHKETLLVGGQVPTYWDVFVLGPPVASSSVQRIRSIRGVLAPLNSGQTEPTRPSRFAYGNLATLNGFNPTPPTGITGRDFDVIWNFKPDSTVNLEGTNGSDAAVTVYWDEQTVASGQSLPRITYIGESTADTDFSAPVSLSVTSPLALGYMAIKDANGNVIGCQATPNPFIISAFVQNLTDLTQSGGITVSPVTVFLDLPKGLALATGETNPKVIANVAPGQEGSVSWNVVPDGTTNGKLQFTVTASPNIGNGKSVQRSVEVPAPPTITLRSSSTTQGQFAMYTFPLIFGNTPPSTILGLNSNPPDFDLVRYNPITGHYEPVNTFIPGLAYWLRSRLNSDRTIMIDCTKFPPLDNQVQPNATSFKTNYPRGWNQIGNPYIFGVRFSEIQVFDQATLQIVDIGTAADPLHQWILPAIYSYETSDPNPANWHYVLQENLGFVMQPYQGYWMLVKRDGLQIIYPGVDTPGSSVTRAALVGVGAGTSTRRGGANNWRLGLVARGTTSTDMLTYIGVAPKATDSMDYYKLSKPPVQDNQLTLDIVHSDWKEGGRLAQDLRSPGQSRKTWDLQLTSVKPNESVTLSWPEIAANVPRNYRLTLVDVDSNTRRDLRSTSSLVITTGANRTRNIQIIAEPSRGSGPALITSFDIISGPTRAANIAAPSSVAINYALSQQAETRIIIRSGNGRAIRTLNGTTRAAEGTSSTGAAVWDMRDDRGIAIPSGVYNIELVAQGTNGQVSRQIRPYLLVR